MFHTQEKRRRILKYPVSTERHDAWLGSATYFWYYEADGNYWGITSKKRTGYFEVYKAEIDCENILDTVFNEEHYNFWIRNIEKAILTVTKSKTKNEEIKLKDINDRLIEKGIFKEVDGVMFQDISSNPDFWIVKKFQYKKRIQLAVYNLNIINNFALHFEGQCV